MQIKTWIFFNYLDNSNGLYSYFAKEFELKLIDDVPMWHDNYNKRYYAASDNYEDFIKCVKSHEIIFYTERERDMKYGAYPRYRYREGDLKEMVDIDSFLEKKYGSWGNTFIEVSKEI